MNKIIITIMLFLAISTQIFAVEENPSDGNSPGVSKLSDALSDFNATSNLKSDLTSINGIISTILPVSITLAGVILLFMLISGGFTIMTAVSDPKGAEAGKQRITTALIGFFLLFLSYWIIQILEIVLGVTILGS